MRQISLWKISAGVETAITDGKSVVVPAYYARPELLNTLSVGRDHNYLPPGDYIVVNHDTEGEEQAVTIKIVPLGFPYRENSMVTMRSLGSLSRVNQRHCCQVFQLMPQLKMPHEVM